MWNLSRKSAFLLKKHWNHGEKVKIIVYRLHSEIEYRTLSINKKHQLDYLFVNMGKNEIQIIELWAKGEKNDLR